MKNKLVLNLNLNSVSKIKYRLIVFVLKTLFGNDKVKDMGEVSYVIWIEIFRNRSQGFLDLSQRETS